MSNISLEQLQKTHGAEADAIFKEIAKIGGFGDPGAGFVGGLDLTGLDGKQKAQIEALTARPKTEKGEISHGRNS